MWRACALPRLSTLWSVTAHDPLRRTPLARGGPVSKKEWKISGAYVPHRLEMLQSPAWQAAPRPMKEWLEVLEIEHMRHKGCANGQLFKSYTQFIAAGFNRNTVSMMSKLSEALGFVRINRTTGTSKGDLRDACAYTLTYLPSGPGRDVAPTDDWKRLKTIDQAERVIADMRTKGKKAASSRQRKAA